MSSTSPEPSSASSPHPEPQNEQKKDATESKGKEREDSAGTSGNESKDDGQSSQPTESVGTSREQSQVPTTGSWQAIWSPAHNAYYFYNSITQETTWTNPLQPVTVATAAASSASPATPETSASPTSTSTPATSASSLYQLQEAAAAQGIDPSLAFLDPSLIAGPSSNAAFEYTAKFNAKTGAFAKTDARDPSHLSEYERAKRMSQFYFDVNAWETEVATRKEQEEAEGKKRKRPTKKDLERYKEQKRLKKLAKTAWLRT